MSPGLEEAMEYVEGGERLMQTIVVALADYFKENKPNSFDIMITVMKDGPAYNVGICYHPENER